jgi:seryl-tRNA synthetase
MGCAASNSDQKPVRSLGAAIGRRAARLKGGRTQIFQDQQMRLDRSLIVYIIDRKEGEWI